MIAVNSPQGDVLIVGGGVIGLGIARELHKRGVCNITVVDKGRVGAEASWAAAGMLAPNAECHADDELFRLCSSSNKLYPKFAAELLDETGVDVELDRSGTLTLAFSDEEAAELRSKFEWQVDAGIEVSALTASEIRELEPEVSAEACGGYFYPNDWQVENRKLVTALRRYCEINGVALVENSPMEGLVENGAQDLSADITVITAGAWTSQLLSATDVKPIRGQMISLANGESRILQRVVYSSRGYLVPRADGRVLVGATVEDVGFDKQVTAEAIRSLKVAGTEICPRLAEFSINEAWAGLRPLSGEGTPLIGRVPNLKNTFVATGHYRNGILLAPITAKLIADEVTGSQFVVPALAGN